MSRDQKPGKVRVIASDVPGAPGAAGAPPRRRRTDQDPEAGGGIAADRAIAADPATAVQTGGLAFVPVILFLLCCATGGIGFTLLVLPSLPQ